MHGSVFARATMEKVAYITYVSFCILLTPKIIERMSKNGHPPGIPPICRGYLWRVSASDKENLLYHFLSFFNPHPTFPSDTSRNSTDSRC